MAYQKIVYPVDSVVERAIDIVGSPSELSFKISSKIGKPISRQCFQGWRKRAAFSRAVVLAVHDITRIPMRDLMKALELSTEQKTSTIEGDFTVDN